MYPVNQAKANREVKAVKQNKRRVLVFFQDKNNQHYDHKDGTCETIESHRRLQMKGYK